MSLGRTVEDIKESARKSKAKYTRNAIEDAIFELVVNRGQVSRQTILDEVTGKTAVKCEVLEELVAKRVLECHGAGVKGDQRVYRARRLSTTAPLDRDVQTRQPEGDTLVQ